MSFRFIGGRLRSEELVSLIVFRSKKGCVCCLEERNERSCGLNQEGSAFSPEMYRFFPPALWSSCRRAARNKSTSSFELEQPIFASGARTGKKLVTVRRAVRKTGEE